MPTPSFGMLVGGKYRVLRALGAGGMGTVYEAENELTRKRAALKWLHPQLRPHAAAHEEAYERVLHEARASARIRHRNVVDVYDVLPEGDSVCLVMELLEGEPLSVRLAGEPLPMHVLVRWLVAVMHGVAAVHAVGVVHRDLKPENIFLALEPGYPEPVPKVIDFGISKIFEANTQNPTHSGISMGTPKYVSYEQLLDAREVDARTDIYALGVILYEALTGRAPYEAAKSMSAQAVQFATTVPFPPATLRPEAPAGLADAIERAIAKERDQRFGSIGELIEALRPFGRPESYPCELVSYPRGETAATTGEPLPVELSRPSELPREVGLVERVSAPAVARAAGSSVRTSLFAFRRTRTVLPFAAAGLALGLFAFVRRGEPELGSQPRAAETGAVAAPPTVTRAPEGALRPPAQSPQATATPAQMGALPALAEPRASTLHPSLARGTARFDTREPELSRVTDAKLPARRRAQTAAAANLTSRANAAEADPSTSVAATRDRPAAHEAPPAPTQPASELVVHRAGKLQRAEF